MSDGKYTWQNVLFHLCFREGTDMCADGCMWQCVYVPLACAIFNTGIQSSSCKNTTFLVSHHHFNAMERGTAHGHCGHGKKNVPAIFLRLFSVEMKYCLRERHLDASCGVLPCLDWSYPVWNFDNPLLLCLFRRLIICGRFGDCWHCSAFFFSEVPWNVENEIKLDVFRIRTKACGKSALMKVLLLPSPFGECESLWRYQLKLFSLCSHRKCAPAKWYNGITTVTYCLR